MTLTLLQLPDSDSRTGPADSGYVSQRCVEGIVDVKDRLRTSIYERVGIEHQSSLGIQFRGFPRQRASRIEQRGVAIRDHPQYIPFAQQGRVGKCFNPIDVAQRRLSVHGRVVDLRDGAARSDVAYHPLSSQDTGVGFLQKMVELKVADQGRHQNERKT